MTATMGYCEQSVPAHEPRVRFSETSEMVLITNLSHGPHKHKLWFTQDELDLIKTNNAFYARVVRLHISKGRAPSASNILGMEKFLTAQLTEEYRIRRRKRADRVLLEALMQRAALARCGTPLDIERLSMISSESSKWARERARAAATFLEQDQDAGVQREMQHHRTPVARQGSSDNSATTHRQYVRRASVQDTKRSQMTPSEMAMVASAMEDDAHPRLTRVVSPPLG